VDRDGFLVLADGSQHRVLDPKQKPIPIDITRGTNVVVGQYGEITQSGEPIGRIGLFDVTEPERLAKQGGSLLRYTGAGGLKPATGSLRSEFIERANVDPMTEIVQLMDAQRQLEANANMIRYQDQTLGRLVNDVGKIS
jgi:flagellar basal body rod protein FlgG